jgi:hypothetical protein
MVRGAVLGRDIAVETAEPGGVEEAFMGCTVPYEDSLE